MARDVLAIPKPFPPRNSVFRTRHGVEQMWQD